MTQVTMYLADDVLEEIERLRSDEREHGHAMPSRTKVLETIIWDGLPSRSKVAIHRARRAKREGKA